MENYRAGLIAHSVLIAASDPKKAHRVPKPLDFFEDKYQPQKLITDPKEGRKYLEQWAAKINR